MEDYTGSPASPNAGRCSVAFLNHRALLLSNFGIRGLQFSGSPVNLLGCISHQKKSIFACVPLQSLPVAFAYMEWELPSMATRDRTAALHLQKASNALVEADMLYVAGFFDGAISRASASSIHVVKAAMTLHGRPTDPVDPLDWVKEWTENGRLPRGLELFYQAAVLLRAEADERPLPALQERAEKALDAAQRFSDLFGLAIGATDVPTVVEGMKPGMI